MPKTICITFDDGLHDQYEYAYRILKSHGLPATFFITTSSIGNSQQNLFLFESISFDELKEIYNDGTMEIGAHGVNHQNTIEEINNSISLLKTVLKSDEEMGFASPNSIIYEANKPEDSKLVNVAYIRTSASVRRNGLFYSFVYALNRIVKSKYLFLLLNKRYITTEVKGTIPLINSVAVKSTTPLTHIQHLINHANNNSIIVLCFHSIFPKTKIKSCWWYDSIKFDGFCDWLKSHSQEFVCKRIIDIIKEEKNDNDQTSF